ncbi:30S ribosomal protein S24e [Candidatus Burarchaeum australiense]|nr:30S ribosomal protein S24e [Candidatus Burarchaeum australiense]
MDIEIIEDKENLLLGRREVKFLVKFMGPTPDRNKVRELVRAKLGVDPKLVVVGNIAQPFGVQEARGEARVYKTEEGKKMEREYILARENGTKGKKKEAGAAPAAKAPEKKEAPAEKK